MDMEKSHILYIDDIKQIQAPLDILSIIPKKLAEKTQTLVFKKEGKTLFLLTTNENPQLYHQILDKLEAQGYELQTYYTDPQAFALALGRYTLLEKKQQQISAEETKRNHAR